MDLKEFAKRQNFEKEKSIDETNKNANEQAQNIYNKYKDYSKNDLAKEIENLIKAQKSAGTFNKQNLLATLQNFSAFIPNASMAELKELIEKIDAEN